MDNHIEDRLLYEFVEGCLDAEERCQVMMHLNQCAHCRQEVSQIKALFFDMSQLPEVEMPRELATIRVDVLKDYTQEKKVNKSDRGLQKKIFKPLAEAKSQIDVSAIGKRALLWGVKKLQPKRDNKHLFRWLP